MLKMAEVNVIRHKVLREGKSQRAVALELGRSRNTVAKYLTQSEPIRQVRKERVCPVREKVKPIIESIMADESKVCGKHRWTSYNMMLELIKRDIRVSERSVRKYMAEIRDERAEIYVPLVYHPGETAEVDFFEVVVDLPGGRETAHLFLMRDMHAEDDFVHLYAREDQVSFLDGHVRAFEYFGGAFQRIIYDRLGSALKPVVRKRTLDLTDRFGALVSHYLFEPCFARPGEGHDKGGVEGRGKGIRLRYMTPILSGNTLEDISRQIMDRMIDERKSKEEKIAASRHKLIPLPNHPFKAQTVCFARVNRQALVRVDGAVYSVKEDWFHDEVEIHVRAHEIEIVHQGDRVVHPRKKKGERSIRYIHYLKTLSRKPQAIRQVSRELIAELGPPYDVLWRWLTLQRNTLDAARYFKQVLNQIIQYGIETVRMRIQRSMDQQDPYVIFRNDNDEMIPQVSLPERLQSIEVGMTPVSVFDQLLEVMS